MFSIIVAHSKNNVIGKDNKLLWHIPNDLKRFKELTMGKSMVMGRKTFESLPGVLPGRKHIVLTRDKNFTHENKNVEVITDFESFVEKYKNSNEEIFVIGGGEIYKMFLPYVKKLYITEVMMNIDGDTKFPKIDKSDWNIDFESEILEHKDMKYCYKDYSRK
ncbi:dihydrofolate reductase [uncultured Clostridium sp.]|jgi:dihydrofolate reductase|uniref:dihydrofolate reductase n=1 Tax=uncultured Clostridium sp. TaxID=59620 RepID=UPI00260D0DE3|nr:dihydrofolate reductase [uncultured Clostridium sp.]